MHESALARRIVSIAAARAQELGYTSVKAVRVRLGAWTGITPDELLHGFEEASKPDGMADAELQIEIIQPEAHCEECGAAFEPESVLLRCAECGSVRVAMRRGPEMEVESVEA